MRNIGEIISSNRKKLKLSQPMLAELLHQEGINLTAKAISKWETNATEPGVAPSLQEVFHFADILMCMIMQYLPEPETFLWMVRKTPSSLPRMLSQKPQAMVLKSAVTVWSQNLKMDRLHGY